MEQMGSSPSHIYEPVQGGSAKLSLHWNQTVLSILLTFFMELEQVALYVILLSQLNIHLGIQIHLGGLLDIKIKNQKDSFTIQIKQNTF